MPTGQYPTTTMATNPALASPGDRLSFTLFIAVVFHATLIFGVGFTTPDPGEKQRSLDITIAHHPSEQTPEEADFLAQSDQQGSGDQDEKQEVTTDETAEFSDRDIVKVQQQLPTTRDRTERTTQHLVVTTQAVSPEQAPTLVEEENQPTPLPEAEEEVIDELSQEIASLQARFDQQRQAYAKRPRITTLTSVSAKAHYEALYLDAFRREVEEMGTRHFPQEALTRQQFGDVRLVVSLLPDGSLHDIEIAGSSGFGFLDQAAVRSVRLASPFAPFTKEMRQQTDILEIIRTWRFDRHRQLTSR